jgi:glycerophosphoryl diester phosphodiesterase
VIGFAHRGAPAAGVRENSLEAFAQALGKGARALESDVWLTADGIPVLVHDELIRAGFRRRAIRTLAASSLPSWLPPLEELYDRSGGDFDLSLDVKDPAAGPPVMELAIRRAVADRLWLCTSAAQVRSWRAAAGPVHLVVSTTLRGRRPDGQPAESRIEEAAEAGADAFNLRAPEWSQDRVRRCHDRQLLAFGWDVQDPSTLARMRDFGCDGIYSDSLALLATV